MLTDAQPTVATMNENCWILYSSICMTCSLKGKRCLDVTKSSTDDVSRPATRPWKMMGTSIDDQCTVLAKIINVKVDKNKFPWLTSLLLWNTVCCEFTSCWILQNLLQTIVLTVHILVNQMKTQSGQPKT